MAILISFIEYSSLYAHRKVKYVQSTIMVQGLVWYTAQVVYQSSLKGQCREIFNTFLNKKTLPGKTVSQNCS